MIELRWLSPCDCSDRNGKAMAAIIRIAAVSAIITILVIALSRGLISTRWQRTQRARWFIPASGNRCSVSQDGQATRSFKVAGSTAGTVESGRIPEP